jgi:MATE family multidrug resistance protein
MSEMSTSTKTALPETWGGEMRALLTIGIPMALAQLVQFSPYVADTLMIGRIGPEEIAAAAIGSVLYFLLWMLAMGPIAAVTPLVSQALGRNQNERRDVRRTVRMSVWACFLLFPFVVALLFMTQPIMILAGQDSQVAALAQSYVLVLAPGLPFTLAVMSFRNFLAAIERTMVPFLLIASSALVNIALNWVLIFGNLGAPEMGLIGAGIASSIACIYSFFVFVIYIKWDRRARDFDLFSNLWKPDWERMRGLLKLGWPISVTVIFEGMLFNAGVLIAGAVGVIEQGGFQIALNVASLAFMMPYGLSMAGSVRIGLARGAENKLAERRAATTTILASVLAISLFALPVAFKPEWVASFYFNMDSAETRPVFDYVVIFLPLAAGFMFFDAVQVAANQLLRGLADVKWPMIITGISYWAVGFPIAYVTALYTSIGAKGIWYGLTAGLVAAFIGLGIRLWLQLRHPPRLEFAV